MNQLKEVEGSVRLVPGKSVCFLTKSHGGTQYHRREIRCYDLTGYVCSKKKSIIRAVAAFMKYSG
ncbi:hypothetical protein [Endozoicomonas sp. SESOKO1]|uniref:hypothetical protein n=1 Tax=Endozoicomonas sp. SESOKO1 TaxID=2828742 RepID=UPI002148B61E|nr:hypothetical protein [Endozoicomonas sp. SESOKO1]